MKIKDKLLLLGLVVFFSCASFSSVEKDYYDTYVQDTLSGYHTDNIAVSEPILKVSDVAFRLEVDNIANEIIVTVDVRTNAPYDKKKEWMKDVADKWSDKVKIINYSNGRQYTVLVDLHIFSPDEERAYGHKYMPWVHVVSAQHNIRSNASAWDLDSKGVAGHEVGHFLGNHDEYGTNDGITYPDNPNNIMCDRKGFTATSHYNFILNEVKKLINEDNLKVVRK